MSHGFQPLCIPFQIQYEITRVRQKMKDLALLHDKHMNRPTLDDSSEEEHAIEITTQEITQVQTFTRNRDNAFRNNNTIAIFPMFLGFGKYIF